MFIFIKNASFKKKCWTFLSNIVQFVSKSQFQLSHLRSKSWARACSKRINKKTWKWKCPSKKFRQIGPGLKTTITYVFRKWKIEMEKPAESTEIFWTKSVTVKFSILCSCKIFLNFSLGFKNSRFWQIWFAVRHGSQGCHGLVLA